MNYRPLKAFTLFISVCILLCGCRNTGCKTGDDILDYAKINAEAAESYLEPIRPGYEGRNPFWNGFAKKFIYAPAFDFKKIDGATAYRFTVTPKDKKTEGSWSFTAKEPTAPLSPIWNDIPVGQMRLVVTGAQRRRSEIGPAGTREFRRDYPFSGPYTPALRDYREAAVMGLLYVHGLPEIQHWAKHTEPDMDYSHNTYPCKIIGATIRCEVLLAPVDTGTQRAGFKHSPQRCAIPNKPKPTGECPAGFLAAYILQGPRSVEKCRKQEQDHDNGGRQCRSCLSGPVRHDG